MKNKKTTLINLSIILFLTFDSWSTTLNNIFYLLIGENYIDTIISYLIIGFVLFLVLIKSPTPFLIKYLYFLSLFLILILVSILFFTDNYEYIKPEIIYILVSTIGFYIAGLFLSECNDKNGVLRKAAYISFILLAIHPFWNKSIIFVRNGNFILSGYMNFAYKILFPTLIFLYLFMREKRFSDGIFSLLSIILLIVFGNRGAILSIVSFIVLYTLFANKTSFSVKSFLVFSIMIIFFVSIFLKNNVWSKISELLIDKGINSDLITRIEDGNFLENNRSEIYKTLILTMKNHNFVPFGVYGDRHILKTYYGTAVYAHNIVLELVVHYGLILTLLLIILFALNVIKIFSSSKIEPKQLLILFVSLIIPKLFVSSTYMIEPLFFFLIGYIVYTRRYNYEWTCK